MADGATGAVEGGAEPVLGRFQLHEVFQPDAEQLHLVGRDARQGRAGLDLPARLAVNGERRGRQYAK